MGAIFVILISFSIMSLTFYFKFVVKIRDTIFGKILSGILSATLLALIIVGVFWSYFFLIGIGFGFICWKSGQLYKLAKDKLMGNKTKIYLRRIFILYILFTLITTGLAILIDFEVFQIFKETRPVSDYKVINDLIDNNVSESGIKEQLKSKLSSLHNKLQDEMNQRRIVLSALSFVIFILIIYAAYRVFLVRKSNFADIVEELEVYYSKHPEESNGKGDNNGIKKAIYTSLLLIIRPFISFIAGVVSVSVYLSTSHAPTPGMSILLFFVVFLTSGYGFTLNDYFDRQKDAVDHPDRILPGGMIQPSTALKFSILIGMLSFVLSCFLPLPALLLNMATIILLGFYSSINNRYGFVANLMTAMASSFVIWIGMSVGRLNPYIILLSVALFWLILGREILLDIRDMESDRRINKKSIPISFGRDKSIAIAGFSLALCSVFIIFIALDNGNIWFTIFIGILGNILLWSSFVAYCFNKSIRMLNNFFLTTRLAFLLIIPGILL
jgi:4-hydroxybenzoate polyprenyltransferase